MKRGFENSLFALFIGLFIFSILMIAYQSFPKESMTGYDVSYSTVSNVSIVTYLSISMSPNLTSGILYGSVNSLPASNVNATHNYDNGAQNSSMYMSVSTDSNTPVDLCIRSNDDMFDGVSNRIGISNETYSNSSMDNLTAPGLGNEYRLNKTGYEKASLNVTQGSNYYYRFWLDVPAATASGDYNNSVTFKGVASGSACGA